MKKRYIQTFETSESLQEALNNNELGKPYVAYLEDEHRLDWNSKSVTPPTPPTPPTPAYSAIPLTFNIISAGTIVWKTNSIDSRKTIQYSKDSGSTWVSITSTTGGTNIPVNSGDVVQFRGNNATYRYNTFFNTTAKFEVEGNIMSLIDSSGFTTATTLASSYTFFNLFSNCTGLTSAENLVLPATTLVSYCYYNMFYGCTSLTTAPELPATTLANNCYQYMFSGCTSLNYIKCLATDISASNCTEGWVQNVASTGTFVGVTNTDWALNINGIPKGWSSNVGAIALSPSSIALTEPGQTKTFDVTSTQDWSATTIPSWVTLSQTAGTYGITTITVTATTIPSTEVQDSLIISTASKSATLTIGNTDVMVPFMDWFEANEETLMDGEPVNMCQIFYIKKYFNVDTTIIATGVTSGEEYDISLYNGNIDVIPDDNVTKSETVIDGKTFWTVDFREIINVNDDYDVRRIYDYCRDELDEGNYNPVYLG